VLPICFQSAISELAGRSSAIELPAGATMSVEIDIIAAAAGDTGLTLVFVR
jgi:hypothetical protein